MRKLVSRFARFSLFATIRHLRWAAVLLLVASTVRAEPQASQSSAADSDSSFSFTWEAPESCPAQGNVLSRAEKLVGHPLGKASGAESVELHAIVQRLPNAGWRLSVGSGLHNENTRLVDADSCDELADAMALLIALSLDPDYAARSGSSAIPADHASFADAVPVSAQPSPVASVPRPVANAPLSPVAPPPIATDARPLRAPSRNQLALGALADVWVGRLPGVAPGGLLRAALSREHLVFDVELGLFPAQRVVTPDGGADLSLVTLTGSLGYALFKGLLTPYAGLELDRLHGVGTGVRTSASGNIWLLGVDGGMRLAYPAEGAVRLLLDARVSVLAQRARFHVDPDVELFRPSQLGGAFGLGAEVRVR